MTRYKLFASTAFFFATSLTMLAAETPVKPSLAQVLAKGGPIMIPIYLLSFIGLCLVFYYLFTLRLENLAPSAFFQRAKEALHHKDLELLESLCAEDGSAAAKVIGAATRAGRRCRRFNVIRVAMEEEGARQAAVLWQKIQYLQDIVVVAPMLGLLGTVTGMINSFIGLQLESVIPKQTMVTSGIAEALITTAAGLVVGIAAMVVYSCFRGRVNRLIHDLEYRCEEVLVGMGDDQPGADQ